MPSWLTPKRYQIGALVVLSIVAVSREPAVVAGFLATVATTVAVDLLLTRLRRGIWFVPEAAIISGLIISLVLLPIPIVWSVLAGVVAMVGKHFFSLEDPILNPAAAGMVTSLLSASVSGQSFPLPPGWLGDSVPALTLLLGLPNVHRNRKWPQVILFVLFYFAVIQSLYGNSAFYGLRSLLGLPWFFTLYILTEPRTSPIRAGDQIIFGLMTAVLGWGLVYVGWPIDELSLLLGLLSGNVFWAVRRLRSAKPAT